MQRSHLAGLVLVGVLAACGGGGGGGGGGTPVAPSITTQPASQAVLAGSVVTFSVVATGTEPLTYQWTKNGQNLAGATSASYTIPAAEAGDSGADLRVVVTNEASSVTSSSATLTVNSAPGTVNWVGTWAAAPYLVSADNNPAAVGGDGPLDNDTLRQIVRVSIGGERFRLRLSNRAGNGPVEVLAAHLARATGLNPTIEAGSDRLLTFNGGSTSVTIAAGQEVTSDAVDLSVEPTTDVAITLAFGQVPSAITGHPGSRVRSYIVAGNHPGYDGFTGPTGVERWYYIQGLEVAAPETAKAVAVLGDSITDGYGIHSSQTRWTDTLAARLAAEEATADVGVLNLGIGGTNVIGSGLTRFEADVLGQNGLRWLIVFYGVNDIGGGAPAADITAAYQQLIDDARDAGLLVYGATILPFRGHTYYDAAGLHEEVRQEVNTWIRAEGNFDAVIDLDLALRDPAQPDRLLATLSSDWLHPNQAGYTTLGEAVSTSLFDFVP